MFGGPLHAKFIVKAAVTFEGEAVRDGVEGSAGHSPGRGIFGQDEIAGRLNVGVTVSDNFQQRFVQAEDFLGGIFQRLDLFFLFGRRINRWTKEDAGLDRRVSDTGVFEDLLQH